MICMIPLILNINKIYNRLLIDLIFNDYKKACSELLVLINP